MHPLGLSGKETRGTLRDKVFKFVQAVGGRCVSVRVWTCVLRVGLDFASPPARCGGLYKLFTHCSQEPSEAVLIPSGNGGSEQAGDCIGFLGLLEPIVANAVA